MSCPKPDTCRQGRNCSCAPRVDADLIRGAVSWSDTQPPRDEHDLIAQGECGAWESANPTWLDQDGADVIERMPGYRRTMLLLGLVSLSWVGIFTLWVVVQRIRGAL